MNFKKDDIINMDENKNNHSLSFVKNDVLKNDVLKNDVLKNDVLKNDIGKNDIGKNDVGKHDVLRNEEYNNECKNDIGKNDDCKNDIFKNDVFKINDEEDIEQKKRCELNDNNILNCIIQYILNYKDVIIYSLLFYLINKILKIELLDELCVANKSMESFILILKYNRLYILTVLFFCIACVLKNKILL